MEIEDKFYSRVIAWLRRAAEQGDAEAQYDLAEMYYYGHGVEQDHDESMMWYKLAAEQGHPQAQEDLDFLEKIKKNCRYDDGRGVEQEFIATSKWWDKMAAGQSQLWDQVEAYATKKKGKKKNKKKS